jgi:hypothetical protein
MQESRCRALTTQHHPISDPPSSRAPVPLRPTSPPPCQRYRPTCGCFPNPFTPALENTTPATASLPQPERSALFVPVTSNVSVRKEFAMIVLSIASVPDSTPQGEARRSAVPPAVGEAPAVRASSGSKVGTGANIPGREAKRSKARVERRSPPEGARSALAPDDAPTYPNSGDLLHISMKRSPLLLRVALPFDKSTAWVYEFSRAGQELPARRTKLVRLVWRDDDCKSATTGPDR